MKEYYSNDAMLDMYLFETTQNTEQLEVLILETEKSSCFTKNSINEIFRIMHTIKGSSAMMLYHNVSSLAHSIEDLFFYLREQQLFDIDYSALSDLVLEGIDFIKAELQKIKYGNMNDGDNNALTKKIQDYLTLLKQHKCVKDEVMNSASNKKSHNQIVSGDEISSFISNYFKAIIFFETGCEMENIRAYAIIHNLEALTNNFYYFPSDILDNEESIQVIRENGFTISIKTEKSYEEVYNFFDQTIFLRELELVQLDHATGLVMFHNNCDISHEQKVPQSIVHHQENRVQKDKETFEMHSATQSIISVNVAKLDKLMDLVGEMVIAEAMVTQNSDLKGLELNNFQKSARQLHKINSEIQNMVMSIRMVPLASTFHKMNRIVRDMSKSLNKEVQLELIGEETEVDKNIIEHISDPLMHLVRNAIDHGIEAFAERERLGKSKAGKVTLEAKNAGRDVLVIVKDDGNGLSKDNILRRAKENDLLVKPEQEMTDKEIYNLIFLPGFSTKESVSEFSGRGVGMDVVIKNISSVGGSVSVDSMEGSGSTITLKIPLTLAIIDGMNVKVGKSYYTIPTTTIKESFRLKESDLIKDPDGNEMIMVRGACYPILRLHSYFNVMSSIADFKEGILIMIEQDGKTICLFADELLGQQQVVVKALPDYIKNKHRIKGLAGCTFLGDGSISLILDIGGIINKK